MNRIPEPPYLLRVDSPIGRLEIAGTSRTVTSLAIEQDGALPHDHLDVRANALLERAARQLERYFAGSTRALSVPMDSGGTPFQRAVWNRLAQLEFGETITYATLAAGAGRPGAYRASGSAVRANPIPLFVPCHRVLSHNGTVLGYDRGEGIPTKEWLLEHEGALER